jgi:Protein of unknown function (DUF2523)
MQFLIAELIGGLAFAMASMVGRALLSLGISFVTFVGVTTLISSVSSQVHSSMSSLPSAILGLCGYLWIDKGITAVFSAWTAAIALKLAGSDSITSMITGLKK